MLEIYLYKYFHHIKAVLLLVMKISYVNNDFIYYGKNITFLFSHVGGARRDLSTSSLYF